MKRRAVLGLAAGVPGAGIAVLAAADGAARGQDDEVVTGGIGMSREEWEGFHGTGEATQNYVIYEDAIYVQFKGGTVSYLEFGWEDPGVPFAEAEAAVRELMPSDARLVEGFAAPATAAGPIGMTFQRFSSRALATAVPEFGTGVSGSILAVYSETAAAGQFEPNASRVSLCVGYDPA